jgi:nucleotide-binding universal stress UspA family protein
VYQRILVPIDGSATSDRGLTEAIAVARLTGASLRLLHVLDELVFVSGFETAPRT